MNELAMPHLESRSFRPSRRQVELTRRVVEWYFQVYRGSPYELGTASMYCDSKRLGWFAVSRSAFRNGTATALFKALVATTLFQRLQDVLALKILQGIKRFAARRTPLAAR
jgi:hypothetical protein